MGYESYENAIAANCTLPVNHEYKSRDELIRKQGFKPRKGEIIVEDNVWVGANCVLLTGLGCVIAASSIVRGEVLAYLINAGFPLKVIGWRE